MAVDMVAYKTAYEGAYQGVFVDALRMAMAGDAGVMTRAMGFVFEILTFDSVIGGV